MSRFACIHGHFYQPPRENPWLEAIELQDSAYPYHDWNDRINAECYAANAASRILDDAGRITRIVNNYARISFNMGPTLLAWLESHDRATYERIIDADRRSADRFTGHGSAVAQAYNHMIMPLANERDKITQVKWGIADFVKRFGRNPEGMWLPETAVDTPTLETLAACGIRFTILAPRQADRFRRIGEKDWQQVEHEHIDSTRAYIVQLPSGRGIAVFFYDGPVSQAIAFERLLTSGQAFAERLIGAFGDTPEAKVSPDECREAKLVNIATDGESYGHHHRHGDMALAFALHELESRSDVELTNYAEFLEKHPPRYEVCVKEKSSWSCIHGVGRWMSNCGCHSGGRSGWNQLWREPLRNALDHLRDGIAPRFEEVGSALLREPWAARDDYIDVINDRSDKSVARFFARHAPRALSEDQQVVALKLLELQRNAMLMYTSCGWFFDELSGLETVQVLQYAGRAVQLAEELFGSGGKIEQSFIEELSDAPSNVAEYGDGRTIYENIVKPAMLDLMKVGGHYAISSLFEDEPPTRVGCYGVGLKDYQRFPSGRSELALGRAHIHSTISREAADLSFGVLLISEHNILAGVRAFLGDSEYEELVSTSSEAFLRGDITETIRQLDTHFGEQHYTITSLFRDDQRRILNHILDATLEEVERTHRRVYDDHITLMRSLASLGLPLPRVLCTTAEFVVNSELRRAFESEEIDVGRVKELFEETKAWRLELDTAGLSFTLQCLVERLADGLACEPTSIEALRRLNRVVALANSLPFEVNMWKTQNVFYELREGILRASTGGMSRGDDDRSSAWDSEFRSLGEKLRVSSP